MSPGSARGADSDSARAARLAGGEIIVTRLADENPQFIGGQAEGVVAAPIEEVWAVLNDYNRYPEFLPEHKTTWIVSPDALAAIETGATWTRAEFEHAAAPYRQDSVTGDSIYLYAVLAMPFPVGERWYLLRMLRNDDDYSLTWQEVVGNLRSTSGSWQLESDGDQTIATYTTRSDVGISVPGFLVSYGLKQTLPDVIKAIRKEAE
jgi:ribosome-associated toxin RatA of RatAB toxin-antitoxin module